MLCAGLLTASRVMHAWLALFTLLMIASELCHVMALPAGKDRDEIHILLMGDTGTGDNNQYLVSRAAQEVCRNYGCSFAILLGDNIYEYGPNGPSDPQFQEKFEAPYAGFDFPFYLVQGNHDNSWMLPGDGGLTVRGSYEVQYANSGRSKKFRMPGRYYHFNVTLGGDALPVAEFFAIDTNALTHNLADLMMDMEEYNRVQRDWLKDALAKSTAQWRFAMGHHPYVSNGLHGNAGNYDAESDTIRLANEAVQLLQKSGEKPIRERGKAMRLVSDTLFNGTNLTAAEERSKLVVQAALLTEAHRKTYKAVDRYLDDWVRGGRFKAIFDAEICGNVDAYISGHDHTLQWLAPVDSCDPDMSFILSGAGAKLESLQDPSRNGVHWQKGDTLGFFVMSVSRTSARAAAYVVNNATGVWSEAYSRLL